MVCLCCHRIGEGCPSCHGLYGSHKVGCLVPKAWVDLADSMAGKMAGRPSPFIASDAASPNSPESEAQKEGTPMTIEPRELTAEEREHVKRIATSLGTIDSGDGFRYGTVMAYAALLHAEERITALEAENGRLRDGLLKIREQVVEHHRTISRGEKAHLCGEANWFDLFDLTAADAMEEAQP